MVYHLLFLSILMSVYTTSYFPKERVYTVEWAGKLSDLYINNNFTAKANLDTMQSKPSLYGFGVAENGEGEILILNGKPIDCHINAENKFDFNERYNIKAAQLTYTTVKAWEEIKIPTSIRTMKQFEEFLQKKTIGLPEDPDEPFPFLLKCDITNIKFRISKGKSEPYLGKISGKRIVMLGFYSKKYQNIFTKEGQNISLYFIASDKSAIGRIDDFTLIQGGLLALPTN
jgi:hypothetical protein